MLKITGLVVLVLAGCGGSDVGFSFSECKAAVERFYNEFDCSMMRKDGSYLPLSDSIESMCVDSDAITLPGRGCSVCRDEFEAFFDCFARPKTRSCVECNIVYQTFYNCKCTS